jgi:hypothetical protein
MLLLLGVIRRGLLLTRQYRLALHTLLAKERVSGFGIAK